GGRGVAVGAGCGVALERARGIAVGVIVAATARIELSMLWRGSVVVGLRGALDVGARRYRLLTGSPRPSPCTTRRAEATAACDPAPAMAPPKSRVTTSVEVTAARINCWDKLLARYCHDRAAGTGSGVSR